MRIEMNDEIDRLRAFLLLPLLRNMLRCLTIGFALISLLAAPIVVSEIT